MVRRHKTGLSPEDATLFERALKDARPLDGKSAARVLDAPTPRPKHRVAPPPPPPTTPTTTTKTAPAPRCPPSPPELVVGAVAGVDRRTADRLRRGKLTIDGHLDLHGHNQTQARAALDGFVPGAAAGGARCVLVITGKGSVSAGGGVLRRNLPHWLNQPPCRAHVLAITRARPEHGGSGAFYVLLKRRRG